MLSQKDTAYVGGFSTNLLVGPRIFIKNYQIAFSSPSGETLFFRNAGINVGMRFKYKKIGMAASVPIIPIGNPTNGRPRHFGIAINVYEPSFFIRGKVRRFSGFTASTDEFDQFRGDMRMYNGILRGFYIFNHRRYSMRSSFRFTEKQKRSQGSWLLSGIVSGQVLNADSLSLPIDTPSPVHLVGYRGYKMGAGGGYAYTYTRNHWFFTIVATAVSEFRHIRFQGTTQTDFRNQFKVSPSLNGQLAIGYNSDRYYLALNGFYLSATDFADAFNVRTSDTQLSLKLGWRFWDEDHFGIVE